MLYLLKSLTTAALYEGYVLILTKFQSLSGHYKQETKSVTFGLELIMTRINRLLDGVKRVDLASPTAARTRQQ